MFPYTHIYSNDFPFSLSLIQTPHPIPGPASEVTGPGYYEVKSEEELKLGGPGSSPRVTLPPLSMFQKEVRMPPWISEKKAAIKEKESEVGPGYYNAEPVKSEAHTSGVITSKEPRFGSPKRGSWRSSLFATEF